MGGVAGVEIRAAFKRSTQWGTPVACGANDGILITPSSIKRDTSAESDDSLGLYFPQDGDLGAIKVEGDLSMYLRYDGCDVALALLMGIAGVPTQEESSSAYAFTYKPDTDIDGLFATYAQHMKNYIMEIPSLKIAGFTIKGEAGKALTLTLKTIGINKVYESTVNTLTTFNNVTYRETRNRVKFSHGIFRMNAQSGSALAAADAIAPSSFELSFQRKLKGEYAGGYRFTQGSNIQELIDEPTNDGLPEISLKLDFPYHTGKTYLNILGGDIRQKMDITFTGGLIADTHYRKFMVQFPHLQLMNDDPADAAGIIKEPLEFKVYGAQTPPAGMTGITDPFWITGINQRSTDPLA